LCEYSGTPWRLLLRPVAVAEPEYSFLSGGLCGGQLQLLVYRRAIQAERCQLLDHGFDLLGLSGLQFNDALFQFEVIVRHNE